MRERKYVKFRVDMFDDTKFKIIDMKPERDLIHYVWTRLVTLAGKVNLEGNLYLSRNIPYTIETLAIEFNRGIEQVKSALDVLIELEMIEFTKDNVYRVKNFVKHQNIKVKEKNEREKDKKEVEHQEAKVKESSENEVRNTGDKEVENEIIESKNREENLIHKEIVKLDINDKNTCKVENTVSIEEANDNCKENMPIILADKKNKKKSKKKKKDNSIHSIDEENEDDFICCVINGERPLREGESVFAQWSF